MSFEFFIMVKMQRMNFGVCKLTRYRLIGIIKMITYRFFKKNKTCWISLLTNLLCEYQLLNWCRNVCLYIKLELSDTKFNGCKRYTKIDYKTNNYRGISRRRWDELEFIKTVHDDSWKHQNIELGRNNI